MSHYLNPSSVPDWHDGLIGLMYHAVEAPPLFHGLRGLYVEPSLLDAQLGELQSGGATFLTLSEWNQKRPAERSVVVTFDDAFQSVFDGALPVLQKRGVTAITYVVANEIGGINRWDSGNVQVRPLMDRAALLDWQAAGQEIGAHTLTHTHLAELPLEKARAEIFDSKKIIEDLTGREVRHFCYPYGSCNAAVRDLVIEAGYETATIAHPGINRPDADPFTLFRHLAAHAHPYRIAIKHRLLHPFNGTAQRPR
jgi:peptidoglycan/xylan/chitin deacetylase (PgdA/CDA1 family)